MELPPVGTLVYAPSQKYLYAGMIYGYENGVKPKVVFIHDKRVVKINAEDLIAFEKFPNQENVEQDKITKDEDHLQGFQDLLFLARVPIKDRLKIILQNATAAKKLHLVKPRLTLRQQIINEGYLEYQRTENVGAPITCAERIKSQMELWAKVNETDENIQEAELTAAKEALAAEKERSAILEAQLAEANESVAKSIELDEKYRVAKRQLRKKKRELVRANALNHVLKQDIDQLYKQLNELDASISLNFSANVRNCSSAVGSSSSEEGDSDESDNEGDE